MMRLLTVGLLTLTPQLIQAATDPASSESFLFPTLKMLGALGVVVGLLLLFYAASRKGFGILPKARGGQIKILETKALGGKKYLSLVRVHDQELLLGISNERIDCLTKYTPAETDFATALEQVVSDQLPGDKRQ